MTREQFIEKLEKADVPESYINQILGCQDDEEIDINHAYNMALSEETYWGQIADLIDGMEEDNA